MPYVADIGRAGERIFNSARGLYEDTQIRQPLTAAQIGHIDAQTQQVRLENEQKQRVADMDKRWINLDDAHAKAKAKYGQAWADSQMGLWESNGVVKKLSDGTRVSQFGDMRVLYNMPHVQKELERTAPELIKHQAQVKYAEAETRLKKAQDGMAKAGAVPVMMPGGAGGRNKAQDELKIAQAMMKEARDLAEAATKMQVVADSGSRKEEIHKVGENKAVGTSLYQSVMGLAPNVYGTGGPKPDDLMKYQESVSKAGKAYMLQTLAADPNWKTWLEQYMPGFFSSTSEEARNKYDTATLTAMLRDKAPRMHAAWIQANQYGSQLMTADPTITPEMAFDVGWKEATRLVTQEKTDATYAAEGWGGEGLVPEGQGLESLWGGQKLWTPSGGGNLAPAATASPGAAAAGATPPPAMTPGEYKKFKTTNR